LTDRRTYVAEFALIGVAAVWGLTFPIVQDAVAIVPTMTFLAYRFIPAAVLVAAMSRRELSKLSIGGLRAGLVMGAFLTAGYIFQTLGLERTTASNAGFITGMYIVLTPVFGALLLGHRPGAKAWIAAAVATLGLFLLSGAGGEGSNLTGDALVLMCAASFALHILATDRAVKSYDVSALLVVQLGVAGLFCLAVAGAAGDLMVPSDASVWIALAITSVIASAVGFFVQTYAQQHASPARTALILGSEPAFAGLFAYLLKGETLDGAQWVGAGLILAAILAVELLPYLRPRQPLPEA